MKLDTAQLRKHMDKIVDSRRVATWGSTKWIKLNDQFNELLVKIANYKQDTLPEHIKKFWK